MRRLLGPLALLAAASVLVGCGSSDEPAAEKTSEKSSAKVTEKPSATAAADLILLDADGFTVRLPEKAAPSQQKASSEVGDIPLTLYVAQDDNGGTFVVALTTYPNNAVLDLDGAVEGSAKAINGTVVANQKIRFLGHPARAARITASPGGKDATVFARTVLVGRKLFQLQYIVEDQKLTTPPPIFDQVLGTVTFD